jgi:hypothetical protein
VGEFQLVLASSGEQCSTHRCTDSVTDNGRSILRYPQFLQAFRKKQPLPENSKAAFF